jgi:hypothetical protein
VLSRSTTRAFAFREPAHDVRLPPASAGNGASEWRHGEGERLGEGERQQTQSARVETKVSP